MPENWDDPDFELPAGQAELYLSPLFVSSSTSGAVERSDTPTKQSHAERDRIPSICITKLSLSPGRLAGQTLTLKILSPIPSHEHWERLPDESGDQTKEGSETLDGSLTPRSPFSPKTSNARTEKGFQGVKDTRVFAKAIRKASPPFNDTPDSPQPMRTLFAPPIQGKGTPDPLNRFGALNHETPAPCEEVKKVDPPLARSVVKIPAKPIVKTLAIHDEIDDWKTQHRSKGKNGAKGGPAVALRQQAAANVHARKLAGSKSFAAVVKKGL